MEKILKLSILIILLTAIGCKPTQSVIEKNHIVSDTLIKIETNVIQLPTNYTLIDKSPCKNDSLTIANQYLEIGKLKLQIKSLNGQLVIETSTDTIISTNVKEIAEHSEVSSEVVKETIIQNVIPKWCWWVIGIFIIYIAYRICRIFFPIIRFLPY